MTSHHSDRELLANAAKAAGISSHVACAPVGLQTWNPLEDDGDALRLAVRLPINVEHMRTMGGKPFGINCWSDGRGECGVSEDGDLSDYAAATRRAIVRAAAALGAAMGEKP